MGITDELRKCFGKSKGMFTDHVLAIADRIDAEHEKAMSRAGELLADAEKDRDYNYANWQDCKQKVLQGNITIDELNAEIERLKDELAHRIELPVDGEAPCKQLAEWIEKRGLITGPLDHDGELWHRGDMSDAPWGEIGSIVFDGQCWQVCGHDTSAPWLPADSLLHYHAPTVEDVLCELLDKVDDDRAGQAEIIAEYAAKLRLVGDAE